MDPWDAPKYPSSQLVQEVENAREYLPVGQMTGSPVPEGHAYPAGHVPVHVLLVWAVVLPKYPAVHAVQAPAPAADHCPKGHTAAVELEDPATQKYPAVHRPVHVGPICALTSP